MENKKNFYIDGKWITPKSKEEIKVITSSLGTAKYLKLNFEVKFEKIDYNGSNLVMIDGSAFSDQDILKLISNLNNKKLISQASLASMTAPQGKASNTRFVKGFTIACILEQI